MLAKEQARKDLQWIFTNQDRYTEALVKHVEAKYALKCAETDALLAGVDGKNQMQRDAQLRSQLVSEYQTEHEANINSIKQRGDFENALRQYELSVLELQVCKED